MSGLENIKERTRIIPEFSPQVYHVVGYIVAALITISGLFLIYEVVRTDLLTFKANWNMFKSPFGYVCYCIGFVCAIIFWGRFGHWSRKPIIEERDRHDNLVRRYDDMDIVEHQKQKSEEQIKAEADQIAQTLSNAIIMPEDNSKQLDDISDETLEEEMQS